MNDFDLKSAFDRLDESLPTVMAPIDRIRARNRRSDRRRSATAVASATLAVVAVLALAGVVGRSPDTQTAARPAATSGTAASPGTSPTPVDPQTAVAQAALASLTARLSGTFTAAGYVIATPKHVEAVWFPGENNLQRGVPKHQMIVVKIVGRFTADHSCPYSKKPCNQNYTSALTFADAVTGQEVAYEFSNAGPQDLTDPTGKPTLHQDLRAIGTVLRLPVG
ncbi:MAG: hypothetical protein DLM59_14160 [Pseudonocardiales bacterium]|nr:MAG: hypothetical protein DLM59_14160 [Pseudonocardiales bacterium]